MLSQLCIVITKIEIMYCNQKGFAILYRNQETFTINKPHLTERDRQTDIEPTFTLNAQVQRCCSSDGGCDAPSFRL